jgi:hypothetical protein
VGGSRGLRGLDLGAGGQLPRRATYRSAPLRRRSLVRAARVGLAVVVLFLVMRICSVFDSVPGDFFT